MTKVKYQNNLVATAFFYITLPQQSWMNDGEYTSILLFV